MPQLFCVLEDSGRSLLTRAVGDIQTPSFPTVGLLCTIATYSDGAGFEIDSFGSLNANVVYRRCKNGLLFVLATSNGLVQTQMLQGQLQVVYDALMLLLGPVALNINRGSEGLRKKLRGITCIDSLIADDTLVPCLMLPVPQVMGLALREKAVLHGCLAKLAAGAATPLAAVVRDGYYLAATAAWWQLQPREALLLQHLAANTPESMPRDVPIYLSTDTAASKGRRLLTASLEGVQVLVVVEDGLDLLSLETLVDTHFLPVRNMFQEPLWVSPAVPQFSSLRFDVALVVERQPACATLLWGHPNSGAAAAAGFNPLLSPTLRRQMGPSGSSPPHNNTVSMRRASRDQPSSDNMQLYFKSAVDLLITFALQCQPLCAAPATGNPAAAAAGAGGAGAGAAMAHGAADSVPAEPSSPSAAGLVEQSDQEFHVTNHGSRMVALLEHRSHGMDVFVAMPARESRAQALEVATKLRGIFCMSYISE